MAKIGKIQTRSTQEENMKKTGRSTKNQKPDNSNEPKRMGRPPKNQKPVEKVSGKKPKNQKPENKKPNQKITKPVQKLLDLVKRNYAELSKKEKLVFFRNVLNELAMHY